MKPFYEILIRGKGATEGVNGAHVKYTSPVTVNGKTYPAGMAVPIAVADLNGVLDDALSSALVQLDSAATYKAQADKLISDAIRAASSGTDAEKLAGLLAVLNQAQKPIVEQKQAVIDDQIAALQAQKVALEG